MTDDTILNKRNYGQDFSRFDSYSSTSVKILNIRRDFGLMLFEWVEVLGKLRKVDQRKLSKYKIRYKS